MNDRSYEEGELRNLLGRQAESLENRLRRIEDALADIRRLIGPFGVAMTDGTVLVQTLHSIKYYVPFADDIMTPQLIVYRQWEKEVTEHLVSRAKPDTVFVDVGANFGYFTCLMAAKIGRSGRGRVVAFEPNPSLIELLHRNVAINWGAASVSVIEAALSDRAELATLNVPGERAANGSLGSVPTQSLLNQFEVETKRLDDVLPPGERVDVMKVDVEGWEFPVLRGAERVLSENQGIELVLEWSPEQMQAAGQSPVALVDFLEDMGFGFWSIERSRSLTATELKEAGYGNISLRRSQ